MVAIRIIIALVAVAWIVMHVITGFQAERPQGDLAGSWWAGKAFAILVGVIVIVLCAKPPKTREGTEQQNDQDAS